MGLMTSKYGGTCRKCGGRIHKGDKINWVSRGVVEHAVCPDQPETVELVEKYTYTKLPGGDWGIRAVKPEGALGLDGTNVTVELRDGRTKMESLGELAQAISVTEALYTKAMPTDVPDPGVYELPNGAIYVVKPNRAKTNVYAKRLVEINAERATEAGTRVEIEFEYEAGAIRKIRPEHRMDIERAKELTIRYGRCINCGRTLKAAESVERGIGPVCIKSFRQGVMA